MTWLSERTEVEAKNVLSILLLEAVYHNFVGCKQSFSCTSASIIFKFIIIEQVNRETSQTYFFFLRLWPILTEQK